MIEIVVVALVAAVVLLLGRRFAMRAASGAKVSRPAMASIGFDGTPALRGALILWDRFKGVIRETHTDPRHDIVSIIDPLPRDREGLRDFVRRTTRTSSERADATITYYMKRYRLGFEEACLRIVKDRENGR